MRTITLLQPSKLVFGTGCWRECVPYIKGKQLQSVQILYTQALADEASQMQTLLASEGITATQTIAPRGEPTIETFEELLEHSRAVKPDCILGIGGGSVLDLAKLLAAFLYSEQDVRDCFGIGLVSSRRCHLICIPTTSGTGSEVSPNAILLDVAEQLKKGVVSEYLVADAAYIDPGLTMRLPADITAFTGLDALTHCIEAYTNKFAHPLIDVYALEGVRLISKHIATAIQHEDNLVAREALSLGSMLGGLCLGPVNTAAVHALAYPLGGEFHLAHGLSNAILLAEVFAFNAQATPERHAEVAIALGCSAAPSPMETALRGAERLRALADSCGVQRDLAAYGVAREQVPSMAQSASKVTRLLKNNPRDLTVQMIQEIYLNCFE
jgi:alcohol dehydrogenase class IV